MRRSAAMGSNKIAGQIGTQPFKVASEKLSCVSLRSCLGLVEGQCQAWEENNMAYLGNSSILG